MIESGPKARSRSSESSKKFVEYAPTYALTPLFCLTLSMYLVNHFEKAWNAFIVNVFW